jgi:sterol desaturase/sphingolipid hydroxylase (fatty acid hydroxylase superfamily)
MTKILNLSIGLLLLALIFGLLHRFSGARRRQAFFRRGFRTDVAWWYFRFFVMDVVGRFAFLLPAIPLALLLGWHLEDFKDGYHGFGPLAALPPVAQVVLFILIFDFSLYWNHRLFHSGRWWKYHSVHHAPEIVDWLSAVRVHPVNEVLGNILSLLPVLLLGFDPTLVAPFGIIAGFYALVVHVDLNWDLGLFRYVIASPVFHRWHHSKDAEAWDKNFAALFPFWDVLFGTFYMPRGKVPGNFGIHEPMSESLWGQLAHPFRKKAGISGTSDFSNPAKSPHSIHSKTR